MADAANVPPDGRLSEQDFARALDRAPELRAEFRLLEPHMSAVTREACAKYGGLSGDGAYWSRLALCFKRTPPARRTPAKRYQIAELGRRRYPVARPRLYFHYLDRDGRGLRREELAAAARIAVFDSREFYALETVALAGVAVFGAQAGITRALPPPACVATGVTLCFGGARRPSGSWLRGGLQNARRTIFAAIAAGRRDVDMPRADEPADEDPTPPTDREERAHYMVWARGRRS